MQRTEKCALMRPGASIQQPEGTDGMPHAEKSGEYRNIPLTQLHESTTNPRKRFKEETLKELAASFATQGVLAPLVVRPTGDEQFEVVAGARRFRAAKLARLESVPARIVELTDAAAIETQVVENLQREDIHPLEEALGFRSLLELGDPKYTVGEIAARSGKSEAYVLGRLKLTELIEPVAEAFMSDKITIGHALLIAKLPPQNQQEAFNAAFRQMWTSEGDQSVLIPVKELAAWIQSNILLELEAAPFDKQDETLLPQAGACANCPKRTGFNTLLFSEVRKDSCTDPQCFRAKVDAHVAKTIESKPKTLQISSAWTNGRENGPIGRNAYVELQLNGGRSGKKTASNPAQKPCRSMTEAIFVDSGRRGQMVKVCTDLSCKIHHGDRPSPEQLQRERVAERKRIEAQRAEVTTRHRVLAAVLAKIEAPLKKAELQVITWRMLEKLEHQRRIAFAKRHKLLTGHNAETDFQQVEVGLKKMLKEAEEEELCRLLMECVLLETAYSATNGSDDRLLTIARRYRIDVERIARSVREDLAAKTKKAANKAVKPRLQAAAAAAAD